MNETTLEERFEQVQSELHEIKENLVLEVATRKIFGRVDMKFTDKKLWTIMANATGVETVTDDIVKLLKYLGCTIKVNDDAEFPSWKLPAKERDLEKRKLKRKLKNG